ncbi:MAG: NADH-quinone oxidoreductase subunit NuoE [Deltaproteobacteria bacterium]|nr:NADH-quinone oxidoreductase subunit NuoE [Deltaproteobacteria bacterium]MBW2153818.1 NADH-quinone oxidoreductase subunit NuoE [Deltaproteobacteria bacterium]
MENRKYESQHACSSRDGEVAISRILEVSKSKPEELIPMLQRVQLELGYLPEKALLEIARITGLPPATVYGAATFYTQFRFHPAGKHTIRICRGTACHVKGSDRILSDIETHFKVAPGETTEDRLFTLETVACFGSCALAPVVLVDDSVKGRISPTDIRRILLEMAEKPEKDSPNKSE